MEPEDFLDLWIYYNISKKKWKIIKFKIVGFTMLHYYLLRIYVIVMYVFNYQFLLSDLFCVTNQLTIVCKTILVHVSQYCIISKSLGPHRIEFFCRGLISICISITIKKITFLDNIENTW